MKLNAISVDVEDYYHVSAFSRSIQREKWNSMESRVEKNTYRLLDIFDANDIKCTFFILGWVAERHKNMVNDIARRGHEVASHGYSHQLIYKQSPKEFREETIKSKGILEDIINKEVSGYRAASYSITKDSLWALDVLVDAGFHYDSSIFPVRHDRYGIPGAQVTPGILETPSGNQIVEFPLTTVNIFGYKLPMAGGGYFRLYPYLLTKIGLSYVSKIKKNPIVFYLHPWEVDPDQPRIDSTRLSRFRHYNNLDKCEKRLNNLVTDFSFSTLSEVLGNMGLLNIENQSSA